jgi:endonuclease YncB( thermonuclease family)
VGIDAPESKQTCADDWPAGKLATEYMSGLVRDHTAIPGARQAKVSR